MPPYTGLIVVIIVTVVLLAIVLRIYLRRRKLCPKFQEAQDNKKIEKLEQLHEATESTPAACETSGRKVAEVKQLIKEATQAVLTAKEARKAAIEDRTDPEKKQAAIMARQTMDDLLALAHSEVARLFPKKKQPIPEKTDEVEEMQTTEQPEQSEETAE
jgi:hypothetical protein